MTVTEDDSRTTQLAATMVQRTLRTPLRFTDVALPTIEHERLGRLWAPQLMTELSSLLGLLGWLTRGGWRGQANLDWYLDSSAVRRLREPRPEEDLLGMPPEYLEHAVRRYDRWLLDRARMAGHGWTGGRSLSDLELLAVLQHHGAATRLMDFTRNAWTALWFASRDEPGRYGLLVGMDLAEAFEVRDNPTLARPINGLLDEAGSRLSTWRPSALSPRISAQQGFFLWGPARFRPWGSIGIFSEPEKESNEVSRKVLAWTPWALSLQAAGIDWSW